MTEQYKKPTIDSNSSSLRISQIIFQEVNRKDPNLIHVKNNILLILLCATIIGMYQLCKEFLDTIILGFLSGVAYRQMRDRFVNFWQKQNQKSKETQKISILYTIVNILLFLLLPWIRSISKQRIQTVSFQPEQIWMSFIKSRNIVVRATQTYLFINILLSIFGDKLDKSLKFTKISSRMENFLKFILGLFTAIATIFLLILAAVALANQIGKGTDLLLQYAQQYYECSFSHASNRNNSQIDHIFFEENKYLIPCSQKITGNFKKLIPKIQNETALDDCVQYYEQLQIKYLGYDLFDYEQNYCKFFIITKQISPNLLENINLKITSQFLVSAFGTLASIIMVFSNAFFSITTFIAIFMITVKYFEFTSNHIYIFGQKKQDLVNQITSLIYASVFITLEHLALSIILFNVLRFSQINIILSIFLSMIAFIPFVQPSFIMILITLVKIWFTRQYIGSILCAILYWFFSGVIYDRYYSSLNVHKVLINLSVVFGIYQFGVSGIFYGPLIILLFQCVYEQLFRSNHR